MSVGTMERTTATTPAEQAAAFERVQLAVWAGNEPDVGDLEQSGLLANHREHDQGEPWRRARSRGYAVHAEPERLGETLAKDLAATYAARVAAAAELPEHEAEAERLNAELSASLQQDVGATRLDSIGTVGELLSIIDRCRDPRMTPAQLQLQVAVAGAQRKASTALHVLKSTADWRDEAKIEQLRRASRALRDAGRDGEADALDDEANDQADAWRDPKHLAWHARAKIVTAGDSMPRG